MQFVTLIRRVFVFLVARVSDRFLEQRIDIKCCVKLALEMKQGAFSMILKAHDNICNGNSDIPTSQESSLVEMTSEDNAYDFLRYQVYLSL